MNKPRVTMPKISIVAVEDVFVKHATIDQQLVENGFDIDKIKNLI